MALKAVLDKGSFDGLDSNLKTLYREEGGKYHLDLEAFEDHPATRNMRTALDKERENSAARLREIEKIKGEIGDLNPEEARKAMKRLKELEDAAALGDIPEKFKQKFDEAVEHKVAQMKTDFENQKKAFEKQVNDAKTANQSLTEQLEELTITNQVRSEAAKVGLHDWAVEDAVMHAKQVYRIKDGKPVPIKPGTKDEVLWGKNPNEPMPISEWLGTKLVEKPGWVRDSAGGGGNNDRRTGATVRTIKRSDARDSAKYRAAREQAKKDGVDLQIVD